MHGGRGRILVFAKAPAAGFVKTRLAAALGEKEAADLARAFLKDTWGFVCDALKGRAEPVIVLEGDPALVDIEGAEIWPQGGGDLGERLASGFARGFCNGNNNNDNKDKAFKDSSVPWVIAVGADSPGMPASLLLRAIEALEQHESVIGPCDDGGFYLLGLRTLPSGLLVDLPWSASTTFAATLARLNERELQPAVLDPWFDIDVLEDLNRLRALLSRDEVSAPATASALETLGRSACRYP